MTRRGPGDPYSAPAPAEPFGAAITRAPASQRILLAAQLEQAMPWAQRHPPRWVGR